MSQQLNCKSTIERAFEIAASGTVESVEGVRHILNVEGYHTNMLTGPSLLKQLRGVIAKQQQQASDKG